MAEERQETGKKKGNEKGEVSRNLPRNYRQIGEPGAKKIYVEDYVYTYLNKLAQPENLYARGAVLFGKMYKTSIGKCIFISGAAACQNFELDLEETIFSEESWGEIYRIRDSFFPEMEICGWFLSRMGFSVDLNDKIIRIHMDNFSGENKVLYMIDALENEDAFYQFENYSLKKQRGYYIYYETNQEMKNYMLAEGEMGHIPEQKERGRYSETIKRDTAVVRNYKKALKKKKNLRPKSVFRSPVYIGCGFAAALVFVYGIHTLAQFQGDDKTQTVFDQQKITDMKADSEEGKTESNTQAGSNEDTATVKEEKTLQSSSGQSSEDTGTSSDANANNEERQAESSEETQETWNSIGGYYTVKRGDTLAAISKEMYHSYNYIEKIAEANGIENVDEIYPGQILELPQIEDLKGVCYNIKYAMTPISIGDEQQITKENF